MREKTIDLAVNEGMRSIDKTVEVLGRWYSPGVDKLGKGALP